MVSAVVLTKNAAINLPRCLQSLLWCDEIIVIDNFSTDDTIKISRENKAQVYQRELGDDFASQRNFGLQKAQNNWVLFVDADEEVSPLLRQEIIEKTQSQTFYQGFCLKRKDFFHGRWLKYGETGQISLLRLAKKNAGIWSRPVHEVWQISGSVGYLKNPLLHYHQISLGDFLERINRYTSVNAKYLFDQGRRENIFSMIFFPSVKFVQNYFFKLGFLDGFPGLIMAFLMSFHSLTTRVKIWGKQHGQNS